MDLKIPKLQICQLIHRESKENFELKRIWQKILYMDF